MEKMTDKEKAVLKELQAKAKRIEREKKKLMAEADQIKDDLLERWGIVQMEDVMKEENSDLWQKVYVAYGISDDDVDAQKRLYEHIVSDRQINYYRNYANK